MKKLILTLLIVLWLLCPVTSIAQNSNKQKESIEDVVLPYVKKALDLGEKGVKRKKFQI